MTVAALTGATVGTPYAHTATAILVDADDGTYTKVWSMSALGGALGLTIDAATGAISGTPTAAGSYGVKLSVTDSAGGNVEGEATLTVSAALAAMASHYQPATAVEVKAPKKSGKNK